MDIPATSIVPDCINEKYIFDYNLPLYKIRVISPSNPIPKTECLFCHPDAKKVKRDIKAKLDFLRSTRPEEEFYVVKEIRLNSAFK